jgi:nitroreductase
VNLQPWYFVAIRSPEEMLRMRDVMKKVAEEIEPSLKERFANHPSVVADTVKFVGGMGNAPACILAFQYKDYEGQDESQIHQSIAAALENMCLVAVEKGMGTCWLTGAVEAGYGEKLRETYAPNQGKMVAMLTLGYPAREAKSPRRKEGRFVIL